MALYIRHRIPYGRTDLLPIWPVLKRIDRTGNDEQVRLIEPLEVVSL
jgi:hypothetical protein